MNNKILHGIIMVVLLTIPPAILPADGIPIADLVKSALSNNPDVLAAAADERSQYSRYQADVKGALPGLTFATDTGNSPLYSYSNAAEFGGLTSSKVERHKTGGALGLSYNLPTGGSMSLSGTGSLDISRAEGVEQWGYEITPGASLYLRQPLFIDRLEGSLLRGDLSEMAEELSRINWKQSEYSRLSAANSTVFQVLQRSLAYNNLLRSYDLQQRRLDLAEKRLELIIQDEEAGRISRLERIAEELMLRRQKEGMLEVRYQIESSERDLENLTGFTGLKGSEVRFESDVRIDPSTITADESIGVLSSEAAIRSLEIAGTALQNGNEPVIEIAGLIRNSPQSASENLQAAFDAALSSEIDLSVSLALSLPLIEWGRAGKIKEAEAAALEASAMRAEAVRGGAELQILSLKERLILIDEKLGLLQRGLEYDKSLMEREQVRRASGLSSDVEVDTVSIDMQDRLNRIMQLEGEKLLAKMELLNISGKDLQDFFK